MNLQNYSDKELVEAYVNSNDHQYLMALLMRHIDVLYRTAFRIMKNSFDTDDAMQIAFQQMITNFQSFKGSGSVVGWMVQVVTNSCYNNLKSEKSRKVREKKVMSERTPITKPKNNDLKEAIEIHLDKLPAIYKLPITLQFMEGFTVKEISDALELPEITIRKQIERGLEKLKASLQRVGVTSSIASIGYLIKEISFPQTPEIYKNAEYFNSLFQAKTIVASKVATSSVVKSSLVGSKAFWGVGVKSIAILISLSAISWAIWTARSSPSSSEIASKLSNTQKVLSNRLVVFSREFDLIPEGEESPNELVKLQENNGQVTAIASQTFESHISTWNPEANIEYFHKENKSGENESLFIIPKSIEIRFRIKSERLGKIGLTLNPTQQKFRNEHFMTDAIEVGVDWQEIVLHSADCIPYRRKATGNTRDFLPGVQINRFGIYGFGTGKLLVDKLEILTLEND